ncbi:polysaccharide deacetylase family protein [Plantibacter sp. YIM 135347]|uniref:polysaccharide deacetylase family protein n=1 Tax=Plantibacter sp. YIM 135347 TaxID=3423919 RepID=UPI003D3384B1
MPLPPAGHGIYSLPITSNHFAWTVDDGGDSTVIRRYAELARDTGTRLRFFPNGQYPGWAESADLIAPMVATGQIQIGNHTYSHLDLRTLSDQQIVDELMHNDEVLRNLFGATVKPFYRPPFGYRNDRTDAAAASTGYSAPVMWYGSLADSGPISEDQVVAYAQQWFLPQHIVIGHANHPQVTNVFPQLLACIRDRGLQAVTLNDVFVP